MIKVFLVDDHDMMREGLFRLLEDHEHIEVCGEAPNGFEALKTIRSLEEKPHVVLMDINMPVMEGVEATQILSKEFPEIRVLALTMINKNTYIKKMLNAGAIGYILKSGDKRELYKAVIKASEGSQHFSTEVTNEIMMGLSSQRRLNNQKVPLSKREKEVLKLVCEDLTNSQIADRLHISIRTVESHKQNLISKTGTNSVAGLVVHAFKNDLLSEE